VHLARRVELFDQALLFLRQCTEDGGGSQGRGC
jgi:hypothetical protein